MGPGSLLTELTLRSLRKVRNIEPGFITEGYPKHTPVLLLSQKNSHALDIAKNVISRWQEPASTAILCVFADPPRADHLRKLAEKKGFNLHVMPLAGHDDYISNNH